MCLPLKVGDGEVYSYRKGYKRTDYYEKKGLNEKFLKYWKNGIDSSRYIYNKGTMEVDRAARGYVKDQKKYLEGKYDKHVKKG